MCCKTSFSSAHDRLLEFVRICRNIACCIETIYIRRLSSIDDDISFTIKIGSEISYETHIWS